MNSRNPQTLDQLIEFVLEIELKEADPEKTLTSLLMADCKYDTEGNPLDNPITIVAGLAVGPGYVMAPMARLLIAKCEPSCAALALPSYMAKLPIGQTLATYGVNQVRDLPADLVQDSLVVHGEDVHGSRQVHMYVIERDENGQRIWVKQDNDFDKVESRFNNLFVLPKMLNEALPVATALGFSDVEAKRRTKDALVSILAKTMKAALDEAGE